MMKIFHILKIGGGLVTKSYSILETLWTTVHQALPSMGFPMQEYWSGLSFPYTGYLPSPGTELTISCMAGKFFITENLD